MKQVFVLSFIVIAISSGIFFLMPGALQLFSFSGETFFKGEVWRLITFSFTHVNLSHLIENIVALGIISLLAFEFGLKGKYFIYCFLLSSILVALADGFLFPALIIAGASLGIYSVLGSLSIKGSNFIPKPVLVPLFGLSALGVFHRDLVQSLLHFSGFISGICIFYLLIKIKKKPRILQG